MRLRLSAREREQLEQLARRARDVRLLRRVQALLDLDAGDSPGLVAKRYQVTRSTIYNWIKRCQTRGVSNEAFRDLPRPGRPPVARKGKMQNDRRHGP